MFTKVVIAVVGLSFLSSYEVAPSSTRLHFTLEGYVVMARYT